ncbi:MAG: VOC family protein [Acidimicrobiia bacterium]|nr:VOC family protein [Acidimicrobiia bacterium]
MLADHPLDTVLLVTDLDAAHRFYHQQLGLPVVERDEHRLVVASAGTQLTLSLSSTGTADTQTQAFWRVTDLDAELDQIRQRGVVIDEFDQDGLTTTNGIANVGFALAAWITDPFGNTLGILQPIPTGG